MEQWKNVTKFFSNMIGIIKPIWNQWRYDENRSEFISTKMDYMKYIFV